MPSDAKPRWITIRQKFDYAWSRISISAFTPGEHLVKAEVADYAVAKGYATEGKADGSEAKASKGKRERVKKPAKAVTPAGNAGTDTGNDAGVGRAHLAADDRAGAGEPVAPAAE
jgi:hypothetical protein